MPAVSRIEQLLKTVVTGRKVGRNLHRRAFPAAALPDMKSVVTRRCDDLDIDLRDTRDSRRTVQKVAHERRDGVLRSLDGDFDALVHVPHGSGEAMHLCQPKDERPKPHPLHNPPNPDAVGDHGAGRHVCPAPAAFNKSIMMW
jgi:hypothetical protein